jgi:hypothetical protein
MLNLIGGTRRSVEYVPASYRNEASLNGVTKLTRIHSISYWSNHTVFFLLLPTVFVTCTEHNLLVIFEVFIEMSPFILVIMANCMILNYTLYYYYYLL